MFGRRRFKSVLRRIIASGNSVIEQLEQRTLFNTIVTDTDPLTSTNSFEEFEYKDASGQIVRVVVSGDVSAEFIFAAVDKKNNDVKLTPDFALRRVPDPMTGKLVDNPEDGKDLFHIYIAQSSIDSYISIAKIQTGDDEPMKPFDGSVSLTIRPPGGGDRTSITAGVGSVYLGALTKDTPADIPAEDKRPILQVKFPSTGIGIAPPSIATTSVTFSGTKTRLVPGISTAPGVNLRRFLFGGTISGAVNFQGSLGDFYCGALLTGDTTGQSRGEPNLAKNFHVSGDVRSVLVNGSIGTSHVENTFEKRTSLPYYTGTDFDIGGKIGQIRARDTYAATGFIQNNVDTGLRFRQQEIEHREFDNFNRHSDSDFENGEFGDQQAFFNNDTFETAQFLGVINGKNTGPNSIQLQGQHQFESKLHLNDFADWYAVPLMAGQTITVRLRAPVVLTQTIQGQVVQSEIPNRLVNVAVFDPDKRMIASDYNHTDFLASANQPFQVTADRPGLYRFVVGAHTDAPEFNGTALVTGTQDYQLQITGVGNLGLGGINADGLIVAAGGFSQTVTTPGTTPGAFTSDFPNIGVVNGDLGAIHTPQFIIDAGGITADVANGNLRDIDALSMGEFDTTQNLFITDGPNVIVQTGSIGLIRSSGPTGSDNFTDFNSGIISAIGGDVQMLDSANNIHTNLFCNGSIGVIRANDIALRNDRSIFAVNVDGKGKPGIIDLIDVKGALGTLLFGGPLISTNVGGNVRYIHVDPTRVFRPTEFGGGNPEDTSFVQGQSATITDDSGANVVLDPTHQELLDPLTGLPLLDLDGNPIDNSGTLTVTTYPIARNIDINDPFGFTGIGTGGGGVAIINVTSTKGVTATVTGGSAEIGEIRSTGSGAPLVADLGPDELPLTGDEDLGPDGLRSTGDEPFQLNPSIFLDDVTVRLRGKRCDVYNLTGFNFNGIFNDTPGNIVNGNIFGSVGTLRVENIGVSDSLVTPGMTLAGNTVLPDGNVFPFLDQRVGFYISTGNETQPAAATISARQAIGNLDIVGIVDVINANVDNHFTSGVFEGINGPVFVHGQMRSVNIGEGILASGTGNLSRAGLYCIGEPNFTNPLGGRIERVFNQGLGSDIRGDIASNTGIGKVTLTDGAIVSADIWVIGDSVPGASGTDLAPTREFAGSGVITGANINGRVIGNIDQIVTTGRGGILGLNSTANNVTNVFGGGFGILNSAFDTTGNGRLGNFTGEGFGIRQSTFRGGQSLNTLNATGRGNPISTTVYSPTVRFSEGSQFDPYTGLPLNNLNDLHKFLGTSKSEPRRKGASNSGVIADNFVAVSRDVTSVSGNRIRSSTFNVPNLFGSITSSDYIDDVAITTGRMTTIRTGGDLSNSDFAVSGPIGAINVGKTFRGTSSIVAGGQNGTIGTVTIKASLFGTLNAEAGITSLKVGLDIGSPTVHSGGNITTLSLDGSILAGAVIDVVKSIGSLLVGGDIQDGAIINALSIGRKVVVGKDLGEFNLG